VLVGQHDHAVADFQLGMADLAPGRGEAQPLVRGECSFVEIDRGSRVGDDRVWRHAAVAAGDRLYCRHLCITPRIPRQTGVASTSQQKIGPVRNGTIIE
jgi:hypothetical protein